MKIVFLGTNGWYTTPTGNTPCILIDTKNQYIILDAGNGIYKLDKYIKENKPIALFISHFHLDHVSGLHTMLPKFSFPQGINVYVGRDRKKDFDIISNPPYTIGYKPHPSQIISTKMEVNIHELNDGANNVGFPVTVIEQFHGYRDHGYKFELEGKTIAYTGDCGLTDATKKLAENADLLITECSFKERPEKNEWGHMYPEECATLAKNSNVRQLILTHFDASLYTTLDDRKAAEKKARTIFPNTIAATDDLIIEL